ncbi:Alpha/Beta hydrolase protein [Lentinula aff. lateritia]|uniref:Alpha/Beta hydrolase protein n=1 Tax=Lentinula aff. lateritia TaxID=2804960 RepID=A0ACC1U3I7_9AGAR|nr:Alpha/Beta hydrolase protein [Lentinula aff. lateritia]
MCLIELKNIAYHPDHVRDSLREFDLYYRNSSDAALLPLILFVHGGAWRSLVSATTFPVIVPNYRLSSRSNDVYHPNHAEDVLELLMFITETRPDFPRVFDPSRIYLISHSCGAHMLASILLDSSSISPTLTPPSSILDAIQGVIFSEGIYDIERLLKDFPDYRSWFIEEAFRDLPSYATLDTTSLRLRTQNDIRWLIIHSQGDTLVNVAQSEAMLTHLNNLYGQIEGKAVQGNIEELKAEHDTVLSTPVYLRIVVDFIEGTAS